MKNLEKVNYRGFIWPVIVGVILWLLTPMKPAAVPVAGWHMFALFVGTIIACITRPLPIGGVSILAFALTVLTGTLPMDKAILGFGVAPLAAAAMVHTGAIVIDQLPQGNYFHVTANAMHMDLRQRSQGILYEAMVGGSAMLTATILYGFLHLI